MSTATYEEPDFNPEDEDQVNAMLERELLRPCETFQGKPLWPFTPGSKGLYSAVLSDGDTKLYRVLAFVFIHLRRTEAEMSADLGKHIIPLVFGDLNVFRTRVLLEFRDSLTDQDILDAIAITNKEFQVEAASEVTGNPPDFGGSQKKSKQATIRRKPRGKSTRRRKT